MNFERRSGLTGTSMPASRPTPPDQAPAARTTTGASIAPALVVTPSTLRAAPAHARHLAFGAELHTELAGARSHRRGHQIGVGVAVARRVGGGEEIAGMEVRESPSRLLRRQECHVHAQAPLQRHVLLGERQLGLGRDEDQVPVLAEVGIDAELVLEALERLDDVLGQLDPDAVRVLVADAPARERRRPRANAVALDHDDAARAAPREVIGGAHAHDSGAHDHHVRRAHHRAIPPEHAVMPSPPPAIVAFTLSPRARPRSPPRAAPCPASPRRGAPPRSRARGR